jgi:hypothetical protein
MPSSKPTLTVRIPSEIRQKLEECAKENDRSISNMLTVLLKDFFDQQDGCETTDLLRGDEKTLFKKIKSLPLKKRQALIEKIINDLSEGD